MKFVQLAKFAYFITREKCVVPDFFSILAILNKI
jgi:hypothetical protein